MTVEALAGMPGSPLPPCMLAAPLPEVFYVWVDTYGTRDSGFLTLNAGFLHCHPWQGFAQAYPDQSSALRVFTLWRVSRARYRVGGSARLLTASEVTRAARVVAAVESLAMVLSGLQAWYDYYQKMGRTEAWDRMAGNSGGSNNPELVQPIGLWTARSGANG